MKSKLLIIPIVALLISACSAPATPTPAAPPVVTDNLAVVADGRLLPAQSLDLSFAAGGQVAKVLVAEGDSVTAGQVLAQLDNSDALQAQVSSAQLDLLSAQQSVKDLQDSATLATAQAAFAVAQATDALTQTQKDWRNIQNPVSDQLNTTVSDTQLALQTAQANAQLATVSQPVQDYTNSYWLTDFYWKRYQDLKAKYDAAPNPDALTKVRNAYADYQQLADQQAQRQLTYTTDQANKNNAVSKAQKAYNDAVANLNAAQRGPDAARLALATAKLNMAQATLADAQRKYARLRAGPDPDQMRLAQAKVNAAQTALTAAQAALADSELRAPFAGSMAHLDLKVGQEVAAGQVVGTLADFSTWKVETTNLTEIEVVRISAGQGVTVTLDAVPNTPLHGQVTEISPVFAEKQGDITYTTRVTLTDRLPQMRWGMTASVAFAK